MAYVEKALHSAKYDNANKMAKVEGPLETTSAMMSVKN